VDTDPVLRLLAFDCGPDEHRAEDAVSVGEPDPQGAEVPAVLEVLVTIDLGVDVLHLRWPERLLDLRERHPDAHGADLLSEDDRRLDRRRTR
jgi:hypothetical protein